MSLSNNYPAELPLLNLDFANAGVLDPRITFTRASTATYFDYAGVLRTAQNNIARFDYNPSTLAAQGLLIEEQRTNSMLRSEEFSDASWTKGGATVTANSTTAPSGTTTADTLVEDTSTGQHRVYRTTSGTTNTNPYTISFFAKASTRTRVYVGLAEGTSFVRQGNAVFDLSAGTVVSATAGSGGATGGSATIQNVGNGWYRCAYTLTLGGTDTSIFNDINLVSTGTTISYTGNGTSGLFIWGAQLEAGAFATSYIPTTTTALTRNADVASMTGTNFSSWFNAVEGTLLVRCSLPANPPVSPAAGSFPRISSINDNLDDNNIEMFLDGSSPFYVRSRVRSGAVNQAIGNGTTGLSLNTQFSSAIAYKINDFAASDRGLLSWTDTSGTIPTVNKLGIGNQKSDLYLNGYIQRISYYPVRLANAQLQALTGT